VRLFDVLRAPVKEGGVYIPAYFESVPMNRAQEILLRHVRRGQSMSIRVVKAGGGWRDVVVSVGEAAQP